MNTSPFLSKSLIFLELRFKQIVTISSLMIKIITILLMFSLVACNAPKLTDDAPATTAGGASGGVYSDIVFAGINSVSNLTDTTVVLNWTAHSDAVAYDLYDITSGVALYKTTVIGQAQTSVLIKGLSTSTTYSYILKTKSSLGLNDSNEVITSFTTNFAPDIPSVARHTDTLARSFGTTPLFTVSNVKEGDVITLYSDVTCTTPVTSDTVGADEVTIDLTSSTLTFGLYVFSAIATNADGNDSGCATITDSYEVLSCPTDYVPVSANPTVGVNYDFCVMKYEAKEVLVGGVNQPVSQPAQTPWVSINDFDALTACQSLNLTATINYDIITNPEWMAVAREIEANENNYSFSVINQGHSDNDPNMPLAVTDSNDPYDSTNNTSSTPAQKRTHELASGDFIWDFSGNVWEITDWALETPVNTISAPPTSCSSGGWNDLSSIISGCSDFNSDNLGPYDATLTTAHGIGRGLVGSNTGLMRGGMYNDFSFTYNGIYALHMDRSASSTSSDVGFRCVYRP